MWKIKDPELKRKVNQFFTDEEINAECKRCINDEDSEFLCFFMDGIDIQFHIRKGYFEEVPEYNPDDWNPFPEVNPPECGEYLVTFKDEDADYVQQNYFDNLGKWETAHSDVIAFRALPAPYQPEADK